MTTAEQLEELEQKTRFEEARTLALQSLKSTEISERRAGAVFLIARMKFAVFPEALGALKSIKNSIVNEFFACNVLAYAAWYLDDADTCRWASHRCMAMDPASPVSYLRLGMLELIKQRNEDAFCVFSAGLFHCQKEMSAFQGWYKLSKALLQGVRNVRFVFEGSEFVFRLATYNGHAMETACNHILGHFCDEDELRQIKRFVGRCDSVVEVGAAIGNHTVFFAKMLSPKTMHVFDALKRSVEQVSENVALNSGKSGDPVVIVHHAAVGATRGRITLFGEDVPVVRLDDEVKEQVGFLKIDVDGMEMEVLEGCRGIIARDRPRIMIEVQNEQKERFHTFIRECGYVIANEIVRPADTNFFITAR